MSRDVVFHGVEGGLQSDGASKRSDGFTRTGKAWNAATPEDIPAPGNAKDPSCWEAHAVLSDGSLVCLRNIRQDDAFRLVQFFHCLSRRTVFLRFLSNIIKLPQEWIERFTEIDHDRDVAIVAAQASGTGEKILGVARIMRHSASARGELAVVIADSWQGKGLGKALVNRSLERARQLGMESVWGIVSADNNTVLGMTEKLGFSVTRVPESDRYEVEMEL